MFTFPHEAVTRFLSHAVEFPNRSGRRSSPPLRPSRIQHFSFAPVTLPERPTRRARGLETPGGTPTQRPHPGRRSSLSIPRDPSRGPHPGRRSSLSRPRDPTPSSHPGRWSSLSRPRDPTSSSHRAGRACRDPATRPRVRTALVEPVETPRPDPEFAPRALVEPVETPRVALRMR
jgi:hypothetical protein